MLFPPTLSLELDLPTAIPSRAYSLVFWRTHVGWSWPRKGCPWGLEDWDGVSLGVTVFGGSGKNRPSASAY